jgi:ABC-2 type transport system ATP-binding protein
VILGLDHPTSGAVTVNGRPYRMLRAPLREVGSMLDAKAVHPGRTAYNHLLALARSNRIPDRRVDEVLDTVGLSDVAGRRAERFSLGMSQRLGIGAALLGNPPVLMFDEPVNGLDTEGIRWIRDLMKGLAAEGRTVFLSSHLRSEMELTADHLVVIGRGRLIADTTISQFIDANSQAVTLVRSPRASDLKAVVEGSGARVDLDPNGGWRVVGPDKATIGDLALRHGIGLHERDLQLLPDRYRVRARAPPATRPRPRPRPTRPSRPLRRPHPASRTRSLLTDHPYNGSYAL